jgi:hypothetical protein
MKFGISRRSTRIAMLVVALAGAIFLISPVGQAQAHHNNGVGKYFAGMARCQQSQIFVHQPEISPSQPDGTSQMVAFRTHLAEYIPYVGWKTIRSDVWKKGRVVAYSTGAYSWTTLDGRSINPTSTFPILKVGTYKAPVFYRVFTEYYWYADQVHHTGSTNGWNPHQDDRGSYMDQSTYEWCKYPGPNWLTIIG